MEADAVVAVDIGGELEDFSGLRDGEAIGSEEKLAEGEGEGEEEGMGEGEGDGSGREEQMGRVLER
jgi:hypothetical protein